MNNLKNSLEEGNLLFLLLNQGINPASFLAYNKNDYFYWREKWSKRTNKKGEEKLGIVAWRINDGQFKSFTIY